MPYTDPQTVVSPRNRWALTKVVCNTGQSGWSAAEGTWDKQPAVGVRWNGDDESAGNPQSHGNPTWFIVPEDLWESVLHVAKLTEDTKGLITIKISRPTEFEYGVFVVDIKLATAIGQAFGSSGPTFFVPKLQNRFFGHITRRRVP